MLSTISGHMDRRLLVNFSVEPSVAQKLLPNGFRPQLVQGRAVVGICLIRLSKLRPAGIPWGLTSENAAHRIAVEWDGAKGLETGVYIFRRDSSSYLATWLGGRIFSGIHHHAQFSTVDQNPSYEVAYESDDSTVQVAVAGKIVNALPDTSLFSSLEEASQFFKTGAVGFSPGRGGKTTGMRLVTEYWKADAFAVDRVESSFFSDQTLFPKGSIAYDHTLIMRNIPHQWENIYGGPE